MSSLKTQQDRLKEAQAMQKDLKTKYSAIKDKITQAKKDMVKIQDKKAAPGRNMVSQGQTEVA